jgi:uncharacterized protein (DUF433 family)
MQLEDYFDFLDLDDIRIKGHRIGIQHVLEYYRDGFSPEQIAQEFPGLSMEKIHATIIYCLHNRSEVDAYMRRLHAQAEEEYRRWYANPSPVVQRLRAIKAQREKTRG